MKLTHEQIKKIINEELQKILEKYDNSSFPENVRKKIGQQLAADDSGKLKQKLLSQMPDIEGKGGSPGSGEINFGKGNIQNMFLTIMGNDSSKKQYFKLNKNGELVFHGSQFGDTFGSGYEGSIDLVKKFSELQKEGHIVPNLKISQNFMKHVKKLNKKEA